MPRRAEPSREVRFRRELAEYYGGLPLDHPERRMVREMRDRLLEDRHAGEQITKNLWPRSYVEVGINNLYRYELPGAGRACYTIKYVEGVGAVPHILDVLTHKEYEELFGYHGD